MITNTEAIKAAARLDQIIGEHVALKKEGRNFLGLCPFHDEKSPASVRQADSNRKNSTGSDCYGGGSLKMITVSGIQYTIRLKLAAWLDTISRPLCHLLGCSTDNKHDHYSCARCGCPLYDNPWFIQAGWWDRFTLPIRALYGRTIAWIFHRCAQCKSAMFLTERNLCSAKCEEEWIPF